MSFPPSYDQVGLGFGDDTWTFSARRMDQRVAFGNEEGRGTDLPIELIDSIPTSLGGLSCRTFVTSLGSSTDTVGVVYTHYSDSVTFRNVGGTFLLKEGNTFIEKVSVTFSFDERSEVYTILSTVRTE